MVKAVRIHAYGGPEVLVYEDIAVGDPGPGLVRVRHTAIGLNFADLHNRTGRYPLPSLPHVLGGEAAGVVEAVGPGVTLFRPGDRVAYAAGGPDFPPGAYAEARLFPADRLIILPAEITDVTAAALFTKGLTAQYLIRDVYPVKAGDTILVHAAAGGVGLLLVQWARHLGARTIGVVSSRQKADIATAHGCHHALVLGEDDILQRVRALTGGEGVPVVFDSVGKDTFEISLQSLRPRGLLAAFGTASGPVPPFNLFDLNRMGSLFVTSAGFYWFMRTRPELLARAADLIDMLLKGAIGVESPRQYALADAARAHADIESRKTTGAGVLLP
jgi:NADPH:quinone reductase